MDMKYLRIGQHVQTEGEERVVTMKFPNPTWPPSINDVNSPVISLDNVSFWYNTNNNPEQVDNMLLHHLTLNVNRGSKIAVVENNGYGKSTHIKMIQGELPGMDGCWDSSTITMTDREWHPERPTSDIATILSSWFLKNRHRFFENGHWFFGNLSIINCKLWKKSLQV